MTHCKKKKRALLVSVKEITFLLYLGDRICVTVPSSSQVQICSLSYARSISPALLYAYVCGCIWVSDVYLLPEVGVGAPDFTGMPGVHLQSPTILNPYLYILLKKHSRLWWNRVPLPASLPVQSNEHSPITSPVKAITDYLNPQRTGTKVTLTDACGKQR